MNDDYAVVYKASGQVYMSVVKALQDEGFHPVAMENPKSGALYVPHASYDRYRARAGLRRKVYIVVPRDEKDYAESFLRKYDKKSAANVEKLSNQLLGQFTVSLIITVAVAGCFAVFGKLSAEAIGLLFFVWIGAFILTANAKKLFKGRGEN